MRAGDRLRELTLVRSLGEGGASDAWLARDAEGHKVVVRVLRATRLRRAEDEERLDKQFEAQLSYARRVLHPGVVRVLDGGVENGHRFVVVEYVDGIDLAWVIHAAERGAVWPSPQTSAAIMGRVARALSAIHQQIGPNGKPLAHLAIAPSKVLIDRSGSVKLADFAGIPRVQAAIETASRGSASRSAYLSPEVAKDSRGGDPRSDLFVVGAILWELVTHAPAFRRSTDLETVAAVSVAELPVPPPSAPRTLLDIARRCLHRDPNERPSSAAELAELLENVVAGHPDARPEKIAELIPPDLDTANEHVQAAFGSTPPKVTAPQQIERGGDSFFDPARDGPSSLGKRFEILGRIGEGGMGEVYRARDRELNDLVALKILNRSLSGDVEQIERMRREVRLARKISSRRVCRIFDIVELEDGSRGLAMELINGRPLSHLIWEGLPIDYRRFVSWAADIAEGLAAAHSIGIVHRDLKPDNIMIDAEDHAVILDFGVAYTSELNQPTDRRLTAAGVILGTLPYMAPEQLTAATLDGRADMYSLGLILAELITGEVPFSGSRYEEVLHKRVIKPEAFHLRDRDGSVPQTLDTLVASLLAPNRDDRPGSASAVAEALRAIARGETPPELKRARSLPPPAVPIPSLVPSSAPARVSVPPGSRVSAAPRASAPPAVQPSIPPTSKISVDAMALPSMEALAPATPKLIPIFALLVAIAAILIGFIVWISTPRQTGGTATKPLPDRGAVSTGPRAAPADPGLRDTAGVVDPDAGVAPETIEPSTEPAPPKKQVIPNAEEM